MKLPVGPAVAWVALYGMSCAQMAGAEPLSLKLSRDIGVLVPKPTTPSALVTPPASGSTRALAGGAP
jgi:hypothetical protein